MTSDNAQPRRTRLQHAMREAERPDAHTGGRTLAEQAIEQSVREEGAPHERRDTPDTVDEAIEQRMEEDRREIAARANPQRMATTVAPSLPDALADKTANVLDMATASNVARIDKMISRLQDVRQALIDETALTKTRIHANIALATDVEQMVIGVELQFAEVLKDRKRTIEQGT